MNDTKLSTVNSDKIGNETSWRKLEFSVPIEQAAESGKDFLIKGVAINSTVTRNGVEFINEELQVSAASLRNKPILKDHNNSIDSIVGITTQNVNFSPSNSRIEFEAKIMDKSIQEKISQGLIQSVSVGAMVSNLEESMNDEGKITHLIARGIEFVELSLVAVPADPNAGLAQAIRMSYDLKLKDESYLEKQTKTKMVEEKVEKTETKVEFSMPTELTEALKSIMESNKAISERLTKLEAPVVEVKEAVKETVKEKIVDETKGVVGNSDVEEVADEYKGFSLERGTKGFDLTMSSYPSHLKKLNRGEQ